MEKRKRKSGDSAIPSSFKANDVIGVQCQIKSRLLDEHPLLNHLILERILQYVTSFQDLKIFRQVCQLWYTSSLSNFRSLARVCLGPTKSQLENGATSEDNFFWAIDNYLEIFHQGTSPNNFYRLNDKPFKRYTFYGMHINSCPLVKPDEDTDSINSWKYFGPFVTHLRFQNCKISGLHPHDFEKITSKLPNLQELVFSDNTRLSTLVTNNDDADRVPQVIHLNKGIVQNLNLTTLKIKGQTPISFYRLLLNSPNIQSLQIDDNVEFRDNYHLSKLAQVCSNFGIQLRIKALDILNATNFFDTGNDTTEEWLSMKLPLEYLSMTICDSRAFDGGGHFENREDIQNVLGPVMREYAGSLKTLKLYRPQIFHVPMGPAPFSPQMEEMTSLRELYLWGNLVSDLGFLKKSPNLKVLHVDFKCYLRYERLGKVLVEGRADKYVWFHGRYTPYHGKGMIKENDEERGRLANLETCHLNIFLEDSREVKILSGWMNNLKCLRVNLDKSGFRAVCKFMTNLEELVLLVESRVDDDVLTGLENGKMTRNEHNLTKLKNLKCFQLQQLCLPSKDKFKLGDKSVYEGFLKMTSLKRVSICASSKMSKKAAEDLKKNIPLVLVIRHDNNEHGDWECCKIKSVLKDRASFKKLG